MDKKIEQFIYITNARIPTEKAHGYQICRMCSAFARAGFHVTLLAPEKKNDIAADPFSYYGLDRSFSFNKIAAIDFIGQKKRYGKTTYYLLLIDFLFRLLLLKIDDDAVIYTRLPEAAFVMKLRRKRVIFESHTWPDRAGWLRFMVKQADKIIATTGLLRQKFIDSGFDADRVAVAPDAVDLQVFDINILKEAARQELDLPDDKIIIGYTGNFTTMGEEKGIGFILQAVQTLKARIPRILFVGVGGKADEIKYFTESAEKKGIAENIKLLPRVKLDKLAVYQKAFDILLMPYPDIEHYRYYMSPLKMFEYMASQRPIIATDLPSVREVLNDNNAFLINPDNAEGLAGEVIKIFNNPQAAESRAAQAYRDVRNYTWEKRAEKILDFIRC